MSSQSKSNAKLQYHDCPSQFDSLSTHAIYSPESNTTIPLQLDGIISYFESYQPTDEDMVFLPHIVLTSVDEWDPYSNTFTEKEEVAWRCAVVAKERSKRLQLQEEVEQQQREQTPFHSIDYNFSSIMAVRARCVTSVECYEQHITTDSHSLSGEDLYESMVKCIRVASDSSEGKDLEEDRHEDVYERREVHFLPSKDKQSVLTPEVLSRKWGIGLDTAARTLNATTHKGMVKSNMPYDRKVRQRFNQLKFPTIGGTWYTDTAFANVKSI
jgi:hypothetical protein